MSRAIVAALLAVALGCGTENLFSRGEPTGADASSTVADAGQQTSFAVAVLPILQSKCSACHATFGGNFRVTGQATTDYANVQAFVNTGSPSQSLIVRKPTGQESHGGGTIFQTDSTEYSTIIQWVTGGANP